MNRFAPANRGPAPSRWKIGLGFLAIYLSWGTTYLAIRKGVAVFPPALFSGARLTAAGLIVLGFLTLRGRSLRVSRHDLLWTCLIGMILFAGGNGLITWAETYIDSGIASVLAATIPLWIALLELCLPGGERLTLLGWTGLLIGLGGVLILVAPNAQAAQSIWSEKGYFLVVGSTIFWAVGSVIVRHRHLRIDHLVAAGYQMIAGGIALLAIGLALAEHRDPTAPRDAAAIAQGIFCFFYLLIVGSLIGYLAYNWLLGHVSAAMVGTYAYVNPMVAIVVGWLFGEEMTARFLLGMAVILLAVALVRVVGIRKHAAEPGKEPGTTEEKTFDWNQGDEGAGVLLPQED